MRGLANLDYRKKILITNDVKEVFKNIEIQERARLKLQVNKGYPRCGPGSTNPILE